MDADQNPSAGLIPAAGKPERYRVQEWLNFTTSELHKVYAPIFRPTTPDAFKDISGKSGQAPRLARQATRR